jgi:hypothetical protein
MSVMYFFLVIKKSISFLVCLPKLIQVHLLCGSFGGSYSLNIGCIGVENLSLFHFSHFCHLSRIFQLLFLVHLLAYLDIKVSYEEDMVAVFS